MQGEQTNKKSWREIDKARDGSAHRRINDRDREREAIARSNAAARQHRNALEALFAPKAAAEDKPVPRTKAHPARVVLPPPPNTDPRNAERRQLLGKFLSATGSRSISRAADDFLAAGFSFPDDQESHVQLLEHENEQIVNASITKLVSILAGEVPKRRAIIEQRLRRIEAQFEDTSVCQAARDLLRMIYGRGTGTSATPARRSDIPSASQEALAESQI